MTAEHGRHTLWPGEIIGSAVGDRRWWISSFMGPRVASGVRTISPWVRAKVAAAVVPHGQLLNVARQNVVSKITRQIAFNLLVKNILFRDNRRIYGERGSGPRSPAQNWKSVLLGLIYYGPYCGHLYRFKYKTKYNKPNVQFGTFGYFGNQSNLVITTTIMGHLFVAECYVAFRCKKFCGRPL